MRLGFNLAWFGLFLGGGSVDEDEIPVLVGGAGGCLVGGGYGWAGFQRIQI